MSSDGVGDTSEEVVTDTDAEDGASAVAAAAAGQEDGPHAGPGEAVPTSESVAAAGARGVSGGVGVKQASAGGAVPDGLLTFAVAAESAMSSPGTHSRGQCHEGSTSGISIILADAAASMDGKEEASHQQQQQKQHLLAKAVKKKKKGCFSWCFAPRGSISDDDAIAAAAAAGSEAIKSTPSAAGQQLKSAPGDMQSVDNSSVLKTTGILPFSDGGDAPPESLISVGYMGATVLRGPAQEPLVGQLTGNHLVGKVIIAAGMGRGVEGMGLKLGALNTAGISAFSSDGQRQLHVSPGRGRSSTNDGDNGPGTPTLGSSSQVRRREWSILNVSPGRGYRACGMSVLEEGIKHVECQSWKRVWSIWKGMQGLGQAHNTQQDI
jgi:hypothetical protein